MFFCVYAPLRRNAVARGLVSKRKGGQELTPEEAVVANKFEADRLAKNERRKKK